MPLRVAKYVTDSILSTGCTLITSNTGATLATGANWATEATGSVLAIGTSN